LGKRRESERRPGDHGEMIKIARKGMQPHLRGGGQFMQRGMLFTIGKIDRGHNGNIKRGKRPVRQEGKIGGRQGCVKSKER